MNPEDTSTASEKSYIPVLLVGLSMIIYFGWQWSQISTNKDVIANANKQYDDARTNTIPRYQELVGRARQVENVLTNLAGDVNKLADDGDELAKQIVKADGIQFHAPAGGAAPAASPTPAP